MMMANKPNKKTGQNLTVWAPSKKQAAVLEGARTGQFRTVSAICSNAKVSRDSFYRWMQDDPGFADAWGSLWREHAQKAMPLIVAAMVRKAVRGDVAAARLVAELAEATRTNDAAIFQNLTFNVNMVGPGGSEVL